MLCEAFIQKDFELFLVGQGVLQMSQISRSCVHELLNVFENSAQCVHTIAIQLSCPANVKSNPTHENCTHVI